MVAKSENEKLIKEISEYLSCEIERLWDKKNKKIFIPDDNFYLGDAHDMLSKILVWLGVEASNIGVIFQEIDSPGAFIRRGGANLIILNPQYRSPYKMFERGAVIAHEVMHYFLIINDIHREDTEENEIMTDLATIYLGLGIVVLNGMSQYGSSYIYYGYFHGERYGNFLNQYLDRVDVQYSKISGYIPQFSRRLMGGSLWLSGKEKSQVVAMQEDILDKKIFPKGPTVFIILLMIGGLLLALFFGS